MSFVSVPKFFDFFDSVLLSLSSGNVMSVKDIRHHCYSSMNLTEEDIAELLPSGRQRTVDNRINWAITYLKKAELIQQMGYGKYTLSSSGQIVVKNKTHITLEYLESIEAFRVFHQTGKLITKELPATEEITPQDKITAAIEQINKALAEDLLSAIMEQSPAFFEKLVVELLKRMGYGGAFDDAGLVVGQTGDQGIDGIIREDKLGFNSIYIQAKRWDPHKATVGSPDLMQFVGALAGQGASKGLFITTAHFSQQAIAYAQKHLQQKIVLIDGEKLAKLMIEFGVGVSTESTYFVRRIDSDFFA